MAVWTWPVTDVVTGRLVHDNLPLRVDYFTDSLGVGEGTLTGSMPLTAGLVVDDVLAPMRRVVWAVKDGQPHGCYVVVAHNRFTERGTAVDFVAQRVDFLLGRRELQSTLVFRQQDQLAIARDLIRYALGRVTLHNDPTGAPEVVRLVDADVPWLLLDDTVLSGVLRDRLDNADGYQASAHPTVAEKLNQLMGVQDGFDYRLDYGRDDEGALQATVRLGYPALGQGPVMPMEYPGNVLSWVHAVDTDDTETHSRVYGAGEGPARLIGAPAIDFVAHSQGWPLLMGSANTTATDQATVDSGGAGRLAARDGVNEGWVVVLDRTALGTYQLGDLATLRIVHPRWGTREELVRVLAHRVEPARQGRAERVTPTIVVAA